MTMAHASDPLLHLRRQYCANRPVYQLQWCMEHYISAVQVSKQPVSPIYTLSFLKKYTQYIEECNGEVAEELLTLYCQLINDAPKGSANGLPTLQPTFKHWFLDPQCQSHVITRESQITIVEDLTRGQRVFELGSGTGLLGLVCRRLGASAVTLTDGNAMVLDNLQSNADTEVQTAPNAGCSIAVEALDWANYPTEQIEQAQCDVVICADVSYDPSLAPLLTGVLGDLLRRTGAYAMMAATIRNRDTFRKFTTGIAQQRLNTTALHTIPANQGMRLFFHDEEATECVILRIEA
ncbi:hypothetical protein RI367_000795 [Sorochytrium milnesiophthora]